MENLAKALVAFQKDMPTVIKDKRVNSGSYSYTYADLGSVSDVVIPLLTKNGLAFSVTPRQTPNGYEAVGVLLHTSGESLEGALPLYGGNPQQIGSSLTYARRYLLGVLTGVVTEDDDDGKAATGTRRTQAEPAKDWDAVADTAESLTDPEEVRKLWRDEEIGTKTPKVIKDRITAHLEVLVKEQGETP